MSQLKLLITLRTGPWSLDIVGVNPHQPDITCGLLTPDGREAVKFITEHRACAVFCPGEPAIFVDLSVGHLMDRIRHEFGHFVCWCIGECDFQSEAAATIVSMLLDFWAGVAPQLRGVVHSAQVET